MTITFIIIRDLIAFIAAILLSLRPLAYPKDRLDELLAPYRAAYDDLTAGLAGALNFPGPQRDSANERVKPAASHPRSSRDCGAGEDYLSAPVAVPCEQDDRTGEPQTPGSNARDEGRALGGLNNAHLPAVARRGDLCGPDPTVESDADRVMPRGSRAVQPHASEGHGGEPTNRSMGYWPMRGTNWEAEIGIHGWARIARRRPGARRVEAWIKAYRAAREKVRHEARMAAVAERCAEPFPYLDRRWSEESGSFPAFIEQGAT